MNSLVFVCVVRIRTPRPRRQIVQSDGTDVIRTLSPTNSMGILPKIMNIDGVLAYRTRRWYHRC